MRRARLVVATRNRGKLAEISHRLAHLDVAIVGIEDVAPELRIIEDGATFEDNAKKKALVVSVETGFPSLADDSGLEVSALGGSPGVHSARFAGEWASDEENNAKLLDAMRGVADRRARYRCVLCFAEPDHEPVLTEGICEGTLGDDPRGTGGFGYDPLFEVGGRRFSELPIEEKNQLSHRGAALEAMWPHLRRRFGG